MAECTYVVETYARKSVSAPLIYENAQLNLDLCVVPILTSFREDNNPDVNCVDCTFMYRQTSITATV